MSVIRLPGDVLRIAFNRDEQLTRSRALGPRRLTLGDRDVLLPIDPQSLGSWIAVNDCGLALGLLNLNRPELARTIGTVSRGRVIPMLSQAMSVIEAAEMIGTARLSDFAPFRLIAADQSNLAEIVFDGSRPQTRFHLELDHAMFTSSGLGDHLVQEPRQRLFQQFIAQHGPTEIAQELFHDHSWPSQPHLSVHMQRDDARTVSQTIIEIDSDRARMTYSDCRRHSQTCEINLLSAVMS